MSAGPTVTPPQPTANPVHHADPAGVVDPFYPDDPSEELVQPSTTARTLRRLRIWLVLTCVAAGAVSLFVFSRAHAAVDTISNRSGPAVEQADAAYVAIANADAEAVHGLTTAGTLSAVSTAYQNYLAAANQSLSRLLADNVAGTAATSQLQLVQELVVIYNEQVHQAYTDLSRDYSAAAPPSADLLPVVDLYYSASQAGDLLSDLRRLRSDEQAALATQDSSTWLAATGYLVWIPVVAAATALVLVADSLVRRRFQRRLNLALAAAALALVAMGLLCGLSLWSSDGDLSAGLNGPLANVTDLSNAQIDAATNIWQTDLYNQVAKVCPDEGLCGAQVTKPTGKPPTSPASGQIVQDTERGFAREAATADTAYIARAVIIAVLALAATALTVLGLWGRVDEYKFEA